MRLLLIAAALFSSLSGSADAYGRGSRYYRSTDGSMVHGPTRGNRDYGAVTARCRDGSRSFSHHANGTCSHHGGVARFGAY